MTATIVTSTAVTAAETLSRAAALAMKRLDEVLEEDPVQSLAATLYDLLARDAEALAAALKEGCQADDLLEALGEDVRKLERDRDRAGLRDTGILLRLADAGLTMARLAAA